MNRENLFPLNAVSHHSTHGGQPQGQPLTLQKLQAEVPELLLPLDSLQDGEPTFTIECTADLKRAQPRCLLFIPDADGLSSIPDSALPCAALIPAKISESARAAARARGLHLVRANNLQLSLALIKQRYFDWTPFRQNAPGVHASAVIHPSAKISSTALVAAGAVIEAGCTVGERGWIGPNVHLSEGVQIGDDTWIWSNVFVGPFSQIGRRCRVHPNSVIGSEGYGFSFDPKLGHLRIPQTGIVVIEDDVEVGSLNTIDRAAFAETRVKRGTKLDAHVHIAHNCTVGQHVIMAGDAMIAGSVTLGDYVVMGGSARVTDHVSIPNQTQLGGLSVATKNLEKGGAYAGYPLQPVKDSMRTTANLLHLTRIRKEVDRILKHLGLGTEG
jgi:UDP-3-O-[3-hydroxymyristoyl] glucosamine N-acyltransferase